MSIRLALLLAAVAATGTVLVCTEFRWGRHRSLAARLAPYGPAGPAPAATSDGGWLRGLVVPAAQVLEAVVDRTAQARQERRRRLARSGSELDPLMFRVRQLQAGGVGFAGGLAAVVLVRPSWLAALVATASGTALGLLWPEHRLRQAAEQARLDVEAELPLVLEQLATMLDAGLSVQGALQRVADRGSGVCGRGFAVVCARVRHGTPEDQALADWAAETGVVGATRLCTLLALQAPDLGRLLETEARQLRRDAHRRLVERIERRSEQVWIPVTVATLVPGVLFLAVPFIEAMRLFAAT